MSQGIANSTPSPVEIQVRRIRELLERNRFAGAKAAAESLIVQVPENRGWTNDVPWIKELKAALGRFTICELGI